MHARMIETGNGVFVATAVEDELLNRIRGEFREMPGMRLSFEQAVRLWALDAQTCGTALDRLLAVGDLVRDDRGLYRKAHSGY